MSIMIIVVLKSDHFVPYLQNLNISSIHDRNPLVQAYGYILRN